MFDEYLDSKKEDMVSALCKTISYPSVSIESNDPSMPFGIACKEVLDYVLSLGESLGFRSKNIDGYCGYLEFGEGEELLGIIGHLDVVPADDNWSFSPFKATIQDGKIIGRGAIDDKGPVISALYAMKAVMDTVKVKKRVRLILGLNEETNWKCMEYYKAHEESPTIGFSPDADFPCIYAEKGILTVYLKQKIDSNSKITITSIDTNNNAINVVAKYCSVVLHMDTSIDSKKVIEDLRNAVAKNKFDIDIYSIDTNNIKLTSHGTAAHAAHPDLGVNAISHLLIVLEEIFKKNNVNMPILSFFSTFVGTEYNGKSLGIQHQDESGSLTLNVGNFSFYEDCIQIGLNLRIPVNTKIDTIADRFEKVIQTYNDSVSLCFTGKKEPLYISKEDPLVKTLCTIFNQVTGMNEKPIAIGGATYARAFPNCISFGANMPGHKDMCHQVDEFIEVDTLLLSSKIYAQAIYELTK